MTTALQIPSGTWTLDPAHTEVSFVARHAMVAKVRGTFRDVEGSIEAAEELTDSRVRAQVQTASVDTGNADRDAHLRGADFFETDTYAQMSFTSTEISEVSEDGFVLTGDLTIKDVTRPVRFDVEFGGVAQDPYGNQRAGFSARTQIDREDWGLTFNAALETGGVLVSKKITIEIEVSAVQA